MNIDWQKFLEELPGHVWEFIKTHGPNLIQALLIYIVGKWIAKIVRAILGKVLQRAKVDPTLVSFVGNVVYAIMLVFVIIAALDPLGVDTTSMVAILGAAGLAVGFALQGSLSNFAAGVMIIIFRPFRKGDFIEGGGTMGSVEEIQIFSTIMKTPDNKKIIVPNSSITGGNITNYSANPIRRVDLVFGIGYGDDIKKSKEVLDSIVQSHPKVLKDPAPVVALSELADSSVNFIVRPWVNTADYWTVYWEITETVKVEFDKQGISIPFPQRDVHLHQVA